MSSIPPSISGLEQDRPRRRKYGGRKRSKVRGWFPADYIVNELPWEEKNEVDNVSNYNCPFGIKCEISPNGKIKGKKLEVLCNHVLNCKWFPEAKKGICFPSPYPSLHSSRSYHVALYNLVHILWLLQSRSYHMR